MRMFSREDHQVRARSAGHLPLLHRLMTLLDFLTYGHSTRSSFAAHSGQVL